MTIEELMEQNLKIQEDLKKANETITTQTTTITELTTTTESQKSDITKLREANMSLFLKVSQEPEKSTDSTTTNEENEVEKPVEWTDFMKDF